MAHILLAGLGDLGAPLARYWRDQGHPVSALRRSQQGPEGIDVYAVDLVESAVLLPPDPVDLLYIILTPEQRSEIGYTRTFLRAPLNLLDTLAQQQPLPPVIFVSSTAVYGDISGVIDEGTAPRPSRYNGQVLLAAEEEISSRSMTTTVRFSGIYGPGSQRLQRQAMRIHAGEQPPPARWTNRIHRDDCIRLLAHLGESWLSGVLQPPRVIGTDPNPASNREVLNWISEQIRQPLELSTHPEPTGKYIRSRYLEDAPIALRYPDYRTGYASILER